MSEYINKNSELLEEETRIKENLKVNINLDNDNEKNLFEILNEKKFVNKEQ